MSFKINILNLFNQVIIFIILFIFLLTLKKKYVTILSIAAIFLVRLYPPAKK